MKPTNKIITTPVAGLSAAVLSLACSSYAATFQWTNTAPSASFVNAANWTNTASPFGNVVPGTADTAINDIPTTAAVIADGDSVTATTVEARAGAIVVTGGELTTSTVLRSSGTNVVSISGGNVSAVNLQVAAVGGSVQISGGNVTVPTDGRIAAANGTWVFSGGSINFNKIVIGSANTVANALVTVSGNAVVSHNQTDSGNIQRQLWLGGNNGGSGTLVLKDNASWTITQTLLDDLNGNPICVVGNASSGVFGKGVLTIQDNASFYYGNRIRMATAGGNEGTINLNGGTLSATAVERRNGTATFNANGGTVITLAANANFFMNFTNAINLQAGGLKFDTGGFAVGSSNVFAGVGGLTKQGSGVLTIARSNSYTGATVVNGDTLRLTNAGAINSSSSLTLNTGTTLDLVAASTPLAISGALTLNDASLTASFATTNITVGSLALAGAANQITVTALPSITSVPVAIRLIKYSTSMSGSLSTLGMVLPSVGSPVGYLTNNVANSSIDLIITSMVLAPVITRQPAPDSAYTNFFAHFSVELEATNSPFYQWRKGGVPLSNGGHISGATTAVLKISNISAADVANYDVVVTNVSGAVTSSPAVSLTLLAPIGYEAAAVVAGPAALYMFDETSDPATNNSLAFDYAGDLDGVYGIAAQNGFNSIAGPRPADGFTGFDATNIAARFAGFTLESHVTIPPLNLNTNTVTLTAWINPGAPAANAGIVFCRGGGTVAGLNFTGSVDGNGYRTLGYTWNNEGGTFLWNSQIAPTPGQWSFVALVISPTNATIYIFDANGLRASSQTYPHVIQSFAFGTLVGEDSFSGNRQFDGSVDGVAVFGKALSQSQLETLYAAASGVTTFPPIIFVQPASQNLYEQQTATFGAAASGTQPLSYQWQKLVAGNFVDVSNDSRINGATTASLSISNLVAADATDYQLIVTNVVNAVTSSIVTLTVNAVGPAEAITNSVVESAGQDWNTGSAWSDGNPASVSAASKPGSTYHIVPGGGLRTPNTTGAANFPGDVLTVHGNGAYDTSFATVGGLILKGQSPGVTYFKKLVLNGGIILSFTDNNNPSIISGGEMNVVANAPISGVTSTSGRSITIASQLTGNGNIEYRGFNNATFQTTFVTALNIAGTNNTFTGTWDVVAGTLVGSTAGALGTNTITVGTGGALQTTYDINNPNGDLILNGRFNLTRNDTFLHVFIGGVQLNAGTYTFQQLTNSGYAANFPGTWVGQTGAESFTNAAGSITVLQGGAVVPPGTLNIGYAGGNLQVTWTNASSKLLEATNILGPWITNNSATSPFTVIPNTPQKFFRLQQ
jgi:autotransporter-associated beta strand protein